MTDPAFDKQFEDMGPEIVRQHLLEWRGYIKDEAIKWLAQRDREERELAATSIAEQMSLARSASAAALAANELAAEANAIARDASASAARSARAAQTSNIIAAAALIAAITAIVVSIVGMRHTEHDDKTTQAKTTQAH